LSILAATAGFFVWGAKNIRREKVLAAGAEVQIAILYGRFTQFDYTDIHTLLPCLFSLKYIRYVLYRLKYNKTSQNVNSVFTTDKGFLTKI